MTYATPLRSRRPLSVPVCALLLLLASVLLTSVAATAQDWKGRGRLQGKVTDPEGEPVRDAKVTILFQGEEDRGPDSVLTDEKGRWAYMGLSSAAYSVRIEAEGYVPSQGTVRVNEYAGAGKSPKLDVVLRPADSVETPAGEAERLLAVLAAGNEMLAAGDPVGARAKYEEVLAAVEDEAQKRQLQAAIADTYLEEGQTEEARTRYRALLAGTDDPAQKAAFHQRIARAHYVDDDVDASVASLQSALELQPESVTILRRIIDTLVGAGREADAEPYMARLPEGEKVDVDALLNLGITAYNENDLDTAKEKFENVLADYPENPDAHYYLGLVHLARGENADAKAHFEALLESDADHPNAAEAKDFLSYLE